jgi:hypothetical protein
MPHRYRRIEEMIEMIDEPNRSACATILADNRDLFQKVQGASHNHQAWPGGYFDHVQEVMNIALVLYHELSALRLLPFSVSDALLVLFLHDIEKPWKYEIDNDGKLKYKEALKTKADCHIFRNQKLREYGIVLTAEQENGMKYVEGEHNDYTNLRRVMGPLAAFCHLCDVTSARIWHNHPLAQDDLWNGAGRLRD